jgi:hypothetical protein
MKQVVTIGKQPGALTHTARSGLYMPDGTLPGPGSVKHMGTVCNSKAICFAVTESGRPVRERPACQKCLSDWAEERTGK